MPLFGCHEARYPSFGYVLFGHSYLISSNLVQKRAIEAEHETSSAYKQIDKLKKKHEKIINNLNQLLEESRLPKQRSEVIDNSETNTYDAREMMTNGGDQLSREEFESFYNREEEEEDLSKLVEPSSWFSGYDRCNI